MNQGNSSSYLAGNPRTCHVEFGAIWKHEMFSMTKHLITNQTVLCAAAGAVLPGSIQLSGWVTHREVRRESWRNK